MRQSLTLAALVAAVIVGYCTTSQAAIRGDYMESRTCDVYTGPCFANGQVGLTGQQAMLAWSIDQGEFAGQDLTGLKVVVAVRAADTLGYGGGVRVAPEPIQAVVMVDQSASLEQQDALVEFARAQAGYLAKDVVRVVALPISFKVDHVDMVAELQAGKEAHLLTRKLNVKDCVCTNEKNFYPPLVKVDNAASAFTVDGSFTGRGLHGHWWNPNTRSAFLGTFGE